MTVCAVLASHVPILWESGIGSDVMKPIAAALDPGAASPSAQAAQQHSVSDRPIASQPHN